MGKALEEGCQLRAGSQQLTQQLGGNSLGSAGSAQPSPSPPMSTCTSQCSEGRSLSARAWLFNYTPQGLCRVLETPATEAWVPRGHGERGAHTYRTSLFQPHAALRRLTRAFSKVVVPSPQGTRAGLGKLGPESHI